MDNERRDAIKAGDVSKVTQLLGSADQYELDELLAFVCEEGESTSRVEIAKLLLNRDGPRANPCSRLSGKTPFHLAAERGHKDLLEILVSTDEGAGSLTKAGETALHCAIRAATDQNLLLDCVKILVDKLAVPINALDNQGYTAVHLACLNEQWDTVKFLIDKNANIDIFISTRSARDIIKPYRPEWIANYSLQKNETSNDIKYNLFELIKSKKEEEFITLLKSYNGNSNCNNGRFTLLQAAVTSELVDATHILLEMGSDVNKKCSDLRNPMMLAADSGNAEILKLLIDKGHPDYSLINSKKECYTILHYAVMSKNADSECVRLLLERSKSKNLNIDAQDYSGRTALHHASERNQEEILQYLLKYQANMFVLNGEGVPAFANLDYETFDNFIDTQISTEGSPVGDKGYSLSIDFNFLLVPESKGKGNLVNTENPLKVGSASLLGKSDDALAPEMSSLVLMAKSPVHRPLLNHPVIRTFLHLKWHQFFWFFYINFILLALFTISLTVYIYFLIDLDHSTNNVTLLENGNQDLSDPIENLKNESKRPSSLYIASYIVSGVLWFYLIMRETIQCLVSTSFWHYASHFVNWLEISLIIISGLLLTLPTDVYGRHSMSAIAILLVFAELVLLIGRHPGLTTYFTMFFRVSLNFVYFLLWYSLLILAFGFSFYILFKRCEGGEECDKNLFAGLWSALFRTIVMLQGEFEANSLQFDAFYIISHIIFLLFFFFMVIVLMNLLNGLAVSDIQVVRNEAEIICCENQVRVFANMEEILFDSHNQRSSIVFHKKVFDKIRTWLQPKVLILSGLLPKNSIKFYLKNYNQIFPDVRNECSKSCADCTSGRMLCCINFSCLRNKHLRKSCRGCFVMDNTVSDLQDRYAKRIRHERRVEQEQYEQKLQRESFEKMQKNLQNRQEKLDYSLNLMEEKLQIFLQALDIKLEKGLSLKLT